MEAFTTLTGIVAPLDRVNVDTDQIIPKQYLKTIKRTGLREGLFSDWRYGSNGDPQEGFMLNEPRYAGANILLARDNFGCGSSREHAPWALLDYGFKCVIAPSFADIFFNNCFKNGMLPVVLTSAEVDQIFEEVVSTIGYQLKVDLPSESVTTPTGHTFRFKIDKFKKECLVDGLDEIALTLQNAEDISTYEQRRKNEAPWLFSDLD